MGGATAARHTTRAETEKAARAGQVVPARDWLRGQVQYAAAGAREPAVFLDRLRVAGVVVRERRDPDGRLSGYTVGRREPAGETVLFGGGKLAADLSLPQLVARWQAAAVPRRGPSRRWRGWRCGSRRAPPPRRPPNRSAWPPTQQKRRGRGGGGRRGGGRGGVGAGESGDQG